LGSTKRKQFTGSGGTTKGSECRGIFGINPHSAAQRSATWVLGTTSGVLRTMMAEPLTVFVPVLLCEAGKKTPAWGFFVRYVITGIGGTADPRSSVVLNSPIAAEEMTSLRFLVCATDKDNCQ